MKQLPKFLLIFVFAGTIAQLSAQVSVSSSFSPPTVTAGQPSLYQIVFSAEGRSASFYNSIPPEIPEVEGLRFQYVGPSHETRIMNGRASVRTSHLYRVSASEPGEYEVPSFPFESRNFNTEIPAAILTVLERGASSATGGTVSTRPVWMEIGLPRENLYVGETTPTGVRLFLNSQQVADASLAADHPEKIGDAFSIGEFGPLSQTQQVLEGLPVTVAEWTVLLTPLKTGPQPLLFEVPLNVSLRNSNRRLDPFESFFRGGSPFSRMFGSERIRAYSEDQEIEILPLPTANRPEDFTGGIGDFQIQGTQISSSAVQVGEPFLFSVEISGQGNFDRLEAPVLLQDTDDWRTYDPESSFTPRDNLGYAGVKSFTFTLIPRSETLETTPEFTLSFFDPETAEYQTIKVPPTPITVSPAPPGSLAPRESSSTANPVEARRGPDLLPPSDQWVSGSANALRPPYQSWFFAATQVTALALLIIAYLLLRHRALLRDDPDYARRNRARRASKRYRVQASTHAAAGRSERFFHSACRALQESVGPYQNGDPSSLTENNVSEILVQHGYPTDVLEEVHHFFAAEEAIQYGGRKAQTSNLTDENNRLGILLKRLTSRRPRKKHSPKATFATIAILTAGLCLVTPSPVEAQEENPAPPYADQSTEAASQDTPESQFTSALQSYSAGDFSEAAAGFRNILSTNSSWSTHYNLGNSLYQLREYPEAILQYERAFALNPTDPDISANLNLAREAASIEPPTPAPLAWIGHRFTWRTWTWLLAVGFWGIIATLLLSRPAPMAPLWRKALYLLFGLIFIASILAQITWFSTAGRAIILADDTLLRIAPTASSPKEKQLSAGVSVTAEESYGEYQRVRMEDGTAGWVLRSSIESVRD